MIKKEKNERKNQKWGGTSTPPKLLAHKGIEYYPIKKNADGSLNLNGKSYQHLSSDEKQKINDYDDLQSQVNSLQDWKETATNSVNDITFFRYDSSGSSYDVRLHMNDDGTVSEL